MPWLPLFEMLYRYGLEPTAAYAGEAREALFSALVPGMAERVVQLLLEGLGGQSGANCRCVPACRRAPSHAAVRLPWFPPVQAAAWQRRGTSR
jgi:hypothetical protein